MNGRRSVTALACPWNDLDSIHRPGVHWMCDALLGLDDGFPGSLRVIGDLIHAVRRSSSPGFDCALTLVSSLVVREASMLSE